MKNHKNTYAATGNISPAQIQERIVHPKDHKELSESLIHFNEYLSRVEQMFGPIPKINLNENCTNYLLSILTRKSSPYYSITSRIIDKLYTLQLIKGDLLCTEPIIETAITAGNKIATRKAALLLLSDLPINFRITSDKGLLLRYFLHKEFTQKLNDPSSINPERYFRACVVLNAWSLEEVQNNFNEIIKTSNISTMTSKEIFRYETLYKDMTEMGFYIPQALHNRKEFIS